MSSRVGAVGLDVVLSQSCYFAGDKVRCRIYIYLSSSNTTKPNNSNRLLLEWLTAQLHGHVAFDPHLVSPRDAADVAEELAADFNPLDREKRLQLSMLDTEVVHRAQDSIKVVHSQGRHGVEVVKADKNVATSASSGVGSPMSRSRGRASSFSEVNMASLDGYDDSQEFLAQISSFSSQSMPDVTLLAGKYGSCLFASPPEVVACAKSCKPGTELVFAYEAVLPDIIPPSYRGAAARYFYVLTVGCKFSNKEKAHVLHVPVRVCSSIGVPMSLSSPHSLSSKRWSEEEDWVVDDRARSSRLGSFSSFQLEEHDFQVRSWVLGETSFKRKNSLRDFGQEKFTATSMDLPVSINPKKNSLKIVDFDSTGYLEKERQEIQQQLQNQHAEENGVSLSTHSDASSSLPLAMKGKMPRVIGEQIFRIGSESRHMANLHLYKDTVCPGEQLLLFFDFYEAVVPCYQVTVALEIEERSKCPPPLQAAFRPLMEFDRRRTVHTEDPDSFGVGPWTRILQSHTIQVAFNLTRSITLNIPSDMVPDFETDLLSVRSYLRFEFVTEAKSQEMNWMTNGNAAKVPPKEPKPKVHSLPISNPHTQTCPWRIPLRVLPPAEFFSRRQVDRDGEGEQGEDEEEGILMLSSSTRSSMLHVRIWL